MTRRSLGLGILVLAALTAMLVVVGRELVPDAAAAPPDAPAREASATATPVLVELFTSEGCSSCPPADAVLAQLERSQPVSGARIVPLALHVDYWDSLGWPDPFASAKWTSRQRGYASAIGGGAYTPEAVIDGRAQMTGSHSSYLEAAITEAAKRPHAAIDLGSAPKDDGFEITLKVAALPAGSAEDAELVVALTQDKARVSALRGENGGKTLDHTAIARELRVLGAAPANGASFTARFKPPAGISAKELHVVAFVQERVSRRVLGVATRALSP